MVALSIIALVIGIAALAVAIAVMFRVSALNGDIDTLTATVNGLKQAVDDLGREQGKITYPNLEGVVYDKKTATMTVKGNIYAEGWVSAGTEREE